MLHVGSCSSDLIRLEYTCLAGAAPQALLLGGRRHLCVYFYIYYKGRQVAGLGLVVIQPSVHRSRHVSAGPTV